MYVSVCFFSPLTIERAHVVKIADIIEMSERKRGSNLIYHVHHIEFESQSSCAKKQTNLKAHHRADKEFI